MRNKWRNILVMLGHKKVTCCFDKSKYFHLANTSYLGSTAHQLLMAELGLRNSIPRDGEIQRILSVRGTSSNVPSTSSYAPQQPPPPSGHPPRSTGYSSKPYSGSNQSRRGRGKVLSNFAEELLRTDLLHKTTKEQNMHKEY